MILKEVFCQVNDCANLDAVGMCDRGAVIISENGNCLNYTKVGRSEEDECSVCSVNVEKEE